MDDDRITGWLWRDLWRAEREGAPGLSRRAGSRLQALVSHARTASPLYRELYRALPDQVALEALPPVTRPRLMADFDDWVTDPRVTRSRLEGFIAEFSYTALLTNLANRVQPFLRYDVGDSIRVRPDPCPCGNRLPALQVRGRSDDVLQLVDGNGRRVDVLPLAIGPVAEGVRGAARTQLVQTGPATVRVRLDPDPASVPGQVWPALLTVLRRYLTSQGLGGVDLVPAEEPPQLGPGGKFRRVIRQWPAAALPARGKP